MLGPCLSGMKRRIGVVLGRCVKNIVPTWILRLALPACITFGLGSHPEAGLPEACKGVGMLVGRVIKSPVAPTGGPYDGSGDSRTSAPAPGVPLLISKTDERRNEAVVTNQHGEYQLCLPAGTYRVAMKPLTTGEFSKDLPATVLITSGQQTRLNIRLDTGIR